MNRLFLIIIPVITTGCGMLEHRDFSREMGFGELQYLEEPSFMAHRDFMVVAGDSGRDFRSNREIHSRTPATYRNQEEKLYQDSLRRELFVLENNLNEQEYQEYLRYKSSFSNTSEKIYFLRLSSRAKSEYLRSRGFKGSNVNSMVYDSKSASIGDVFLGMTKDDVSRNWGRPVSREVAGDPSDQNERWIYSQGGRVRHIYFESGKVSGWTSE